MPALLTAPRQLGHLPPTDYHLPPSTCHPLTATWLLPPANCHLPTATCQLPPAICHLPSATYQLPIFFTGFLFTKKNSPRIFSTSNFFPPEFFTHQKFFQQEKHKSGPEEPHCCSRRLQPSQKAAHRVVIFL